METEIPLMLNALDLPRRVPGAGALLSGAF
jgi:hypothetical protein